MKRIVLVGLFGVLLSASAFARSYGTAGCGLGSMLLGDKKGMMQVFAATTNGTFGSQTFGISSGTSNCTDGSGKTAAFFIEANKTALANDIAKGNGETIDSLGVIYKCQNVEAMGPALQRNYQDIFSEEATAEQINSQIQEVLAQPELACSLS